MVGQDLGGTFVKQVTASAQSCGKTSVPQRICAEHCMVSIYLFSANTEWVILFFEKLSLLVLC